MLINYVVLCCEWSIVIFAPECWFPRFSTKTKFRRKTKGGVSLANKKTHFYWVKSNFNYVWDINIVLTVRFYAEFCKWEKKAALTST